MKRLFWAALMLLVNVVAYAQTESERYEQRYDLLVSQFGPAGVGIETVLDNWEKVDSTNAKMLLGRFTYLITKAQSGQVEARPGKKYLGMDPVLTLKDSLGNDVHYFNINVFDDGKFLLPIFTMGKYFERDGKRLLPLAIQVHHAVCDGYHIGVFVEKLQGYIDHF